MKNRSITATLVWFVLAVFVQMAAAQNTPIPTNAPTVTISATDPSASEVGPDPGTLTVSRKGGTNDPLTVFYRIGGTASNGVDYQLIPNTVTIPAGAVSAPITITPIPDTLLEGKETVEIGIVPSPLLSALTQYLIGTPRSAVVTIADGPVVSTQEVVNIVATDPDATEIPVVPPGMGRPQLIDPAIFTVTRHGDTGFPMVVFYGIGGTASNGVDYDALPGMVTIPAGADAATIEVIPIDDFLVEGTETVVITILPPICPAIFPPPPGCYLVGSSSRAEAFIHDNDVNTSNVPPVVKIVTPGDGAHFIAPANVLIVAHAEDVDDAVSTVEFFEGTNSLGVRTNLPVLNPIGPFVLVWSNVPPGEYTLTALATDARGASSVSPPVKIAVRLVPPQEVVNIVATDPDATEIPVVPPGMGRPQLIDPAVFTVTRRGDTGFPMVVFYDIGGTASNGVDYDALPGMVTIPAGADAATIEVIPIDDFLVEGTETVVITILPPICPAIFPPPPGCYLVGSSSRAEAFIHDNDVSNSNVPPVVKIVTPGDGAHFIAPANVVIVAHAEDVDDAVSTVEFFEGKNSLGVRTNLPVANPIGPFVLVWSNVPPGEYTLTALATDARGATGSSAPIHIVVQTNRPPETNPPVVTIVATDPIASEGTNFWWWPICTLAGDWQSNLPPTLIWGPNPPGVNTATFKVRRSDGTNSDLTVYYAIGGTASNGVDYETLPGSMIIPAGERSARITITPLDDAFVRPIETVILKLQLPPETTPATPSPYRIGSPGRAAAIIVEHDGPRPPCRHLDDGSFHLCRPGTNGFWFRIEASTNLVNWMPVCTNRVTDGAIHFVDPDAKDSANRYYRTFPEPNPPAD